jgi:hypothetical protein
MVKIETKLTGDIFAGLDRYAEKIQDSVIFSGAAAMAKVIYDEVRLNTSGTRAGTPGRLSKPHYFYGTHQKYLLQPGNLHDAIYRVYSPERSAPGRKTYKVSWNHQKAPQGFMVEYGTSHARAYPFMRPAFSRIQDAIDAGMDRMRVRLLEGGRIPVVRIDEPG